MIAHVRCVVTSRTCARKCCDAERIVHASDVRYREAACIEDFLPSRDGFAGICIWITLGAGQIPPGIEERECTLIESGTQYVVDTM